MMPESEIKRDKGGGGPRKGCGVGKKKIHAGSRRTVEGGKILGLGEGKKRGNWLF